MPNIKQQQAPNCNYFIVPFEKQGKADVNSPTDQRPKNTHNQESQRY